MSNDSILIAGCGRSGTTWLSEIVNYDRAFQLIFEPLRHDIGADVAKKLGYWPYLRPGDAPPDIVNGVRDVLTGQFANDWSDRFRRAGSHRYLVKEIRAHFLLGWLRTAFPGLPIVLMLRHPCAVAVSELRLGWTRWDEPLAAMFNQPALMRDHLGPYVEVIRAAETPFERRIALWCVRNLVPLRQLKRGDVHLVFYERLLVDPMGEIRPLFRYLGRPIDEGAILTVWRRPSAMTMGREGEPSGSDRLSGWRAVISEADRARACALLRAFGMNGMYGDDVMPEVAGAESLQECRVDAESRS